MAVPALARLRMAGMGVGLQYAEFAYELDGAGTSVGWGEAYDLMCAEGVRSSVYDDNYGGGWIDDENNEDTDDKYAGAMRKETGHDFQDKPFN